VSRDPQARLILEGHPFRVLIRMAVPAVAVMLMFGLNAVMDAVYIGQLIGEQALAGVSLAFPVTQLTLGLGSLGGIGGGVLLSIAIGRGDSDLLRRLPGTCLGIAGVLSLVYAVAGAGFAEALVRGMGAGGALEPRTGAPARHGSEGPIEGPLRPGPPGPLRKMESTIASSHKVHSRSMPVAP